MTKLIMTADDSASIRQMVAFTIKQYGYEVIEAVDGQDALAKLATQKVDLLLTDLNMPKLDGIEVIKGVRRSALNKFIPIVMLTTESQDHQKAAGKAAGASGWIVKPFKPDQLTGVIKKLLG